MSEFINEPEKFTFKPKYYRRQPYANVILDREHQIRQNRSVRRGEPLQNNL
jgi:hypothetical protein